MICEKPASRTASSLAGSVPASEIVSMPKSPMFGSGAIGLTPNTRSSAFIVNQLEHDAAEVRLRQCAARFRVHVLRRDEPDASLAQRLYRTEHVWRAEADPLQRFLRLDVENAAPWIAPLQVACAPRAPPGA